MDKYDNCRQFQMVSGVRICGANRGSGGAESLYDEERGKEGKRVVQSRALWMKLVGVWWACE